MHDSNKKLSSSFGSSSIMEEADIELTETNMQNSNYSKLIKRSPIVVLLVCISVVVLTLNSNGGQSSNNMVQTIAQRKLEDKPLAKSIADCIGDKYILIISNTIFRYYFSISSYLNSPLPLSTSSRLPHLFTSPPLHLFTSPPLHLSTSPPLHLFTSSPLHLSTYPPLHLSTSPPLLNLFTTPPLHLF